jgi:protease-4
MALDVDALIDRRRMARRLAVWRGLAILVVIAAAAGAAWRFGDLGPQHIARLPINGAIVSDRPLIRLIERLKENDNVAAVVVSIDSPGGTSVGGERLYDALRDLAAEKPVVSHINTLGASAAYMTALATDHIVAHRTSLTGSIGVLIQYGQINGLLDSWGIEVAKVESGPLKAEPNPFEPTDPAAVAVLQSVVDDSFAYFLSLVQERRNLPEADARRLSDGRIYTGGQALAEGLVDEIGGEEAAVAWLERERGVAADLPLRTYEPRDAGEGSLTARMAEAALSRVLGAIGITLPPLPPSGSVDGLWSVWHAAGSSDTRTRQE